MTLQSAKIGGVYTVKSMDLDAAMRQRLCALGLTSGTSVRILNRSREGSVILMVRGSRLALGKKISASIRMLEAGQ